MKNSIDSTHVCGYNTRHANHKIFMEIMTMHTKEDTLKVRMDAPTLELIERASRYISLDKSKFIRRSVREKAREILAQHEKTLFSTEDWQGFFKMLENRDEPTARMKKASLKYKKIISSNEIGKS